MEGERDGAVEEAQEGQGQPEEPQEPEAQQVDGASDYKELLDKQDERIRELELRVADVIGIEEADVMDCFVQAGAELQRTQVVPGWI